jgi:hypothetical protein
MKKWLMPAALAAIAAFAMPVMAASKLGDLSKLEKIAHDTLVLVDKGDLKAAQKRITNFESAWDKAEPKLRPKDKNEWGVIDDAADAAIASLRSKSPDATDAQKTVSALIDAIKNPTAE